MQNLFLLNRQHLLGGLGGDVEMVQRWRPLICCTFCIFKAAANSRSWTQPELSSGFCHVAAANLFSNYANEELGWKYNDALKYYWKIIWLVILGIFLYYPLILMHHGWSDYFMWITISCGLKFSNLHWCDSWKVGKCLYVTLHRSHNTSRKVTWPCLTGPLTCKTCF